VRPDVLQARLDFYDDSIVLSTFDKGANTIKTVDATNIAQAFLSETQLHSGLLPANALWWRQSRNGTEVAIYQKPKVWMLAVQTDLSHPALRFQIPMPGLIFRCFQGQAPKVYAVTGPPRRLNTPIYHAPTFNTYADGGTCAGTHKYPNNPAEVPLSFFTSFFTRTVDHVCSKKYGSNITELWKSLEGKNKYPNSDLVKMGTVDELINGRT
jgi:hypothetical protein